MGRRAIVTTLALVAAVLAWGLLAPSPARAQTADPVKIRVIITDNGWNDQGSKFQINVEEGQTIELTFVWDQKIHVEDEHIFVLDGYNLEWASITAHNREATLKFVADKPGAFRIKCDVECEVHDQLKNGILNVARRGTGSAKGAGPGSATGGPDIRPESKLTVGAPVSAVTGQTAALAVTAVDAGGAPIVGAAVHLMETMAFLGAKEQDVEVASARTDKSGKATLSYDVRRTGNRPLKVVYDGDPDHRPALLEFKVAVTAGDATYHVESPPSIPGVNRFLVSAVLIAVWGTMLIVALHAVAIVRAGRRATPETGERSG